MASSLADQYKGQSLKLMVDTHPSGSRTLRIVKEDNNLGEDAPPGFGLFVNSDEALFYRTLSEFIAICAITGIKIESYRAFSE